MPSANVSDLQINYRAGGSGFPLVLIHGLGGSLEGWDARFVSLLEQHYYVVALDNRGSGKTRAPRGEGFSIGLFAEDVTGLMKTLGIRRTHVLGFSIGGMVAQELAISHPETVAKLVLTSTNCGGLECITPEGGVADGPSNGQGTPEEQACRYISTLFPDSWLEEHEEYMRGLTQRFLESVESNEDVPKQFMAGVRFDSCARLGEIKCPTMVACGTDDEVILPENSKILADRIPDARLVEYPGVGHGFMTQMPVEFARDVIAFLG